MSTNRIVILQSKKNQIKLLQARQATYSMAKEALVLQILLTLFVPAIGGIAIIFWPESRALFAACSLLVLLLDALMLDPLQKKLLKRAANISEQFDTTVLDLEWDEFSVGDKLVPEDVSGAARAYGKPGNSSKLETWYPEIVGEFPMHLGRIVCQRINLVYDRKLRQFYASLLKVCCVVVVAFFLILGFVDGSSLGEFVLTIVPAVPFLSWAIREYQRQADTADRMDALSREALKLWKQALNGVIGEDECRERSREFQTAIYQRRANSTLIMPSLYYFMRQNLENETRDGGRVFTSRILQ